jgi:hypothetical protein
VSIPFVVFRAAILPFDKVFYDWFTMASISPNTSVKEALDLVRLLVVYVSFYSDGGGLVNFAVKRICTWMGFQVGH